MKSEYKGEHSSFISSLHNQSLIKQSYQWCYIARKVSPVHQILSTSHLPQIRKMKSTLTVSLIGLLFTMCVAQKITDGKASFYFQGGIQGAPPVAGSCGETHGDSDLVVAAPEGLLPDSCGKTVMITNTGAGNGAGNTVSATIADKCPSCDPSHLGMFLHSLCRILVD
jgi:hypothetical protein